MAVIKVIKLLYYKILIKTVGGMQGGL